MGNTVTAAAGHRSLSNLGRGIRAVVKDINGGRAMAQRMSMLGIRPGVEMHIVHGPGMRGAVVQVGAARIALGRALTDCVWVELAALPEGAL